MNKVNFARVLAHIKARPDLWDQGNYQSLTAHPDCPRCFVGHAGLFGGYHPDSQLNQMIWETGAEFLCVTREEEDWLCASENTLAHFEAFENAGTIPPHSDTLPLTMWQRRQTDKIYGPASRVSYVRP